jgi:TolA-binding protein
MLWASAAASLASRDYQNADRILSLLCDRFPDTSAADSARQALAQLR